MRRLPVPAVVLFRGQPWYNPGGSKPCLYRPGPDGHQRDGNYTPIHWETIDGLVHQASIHNNQTLCELGRQPPRLLDLMVAAGTYERVTCIACMGYVTWRDYPVE